MQPRGAVIAVAVAAAVVGGVGSAALAAQTQVARSAAPTCTVAQLALRAKPGAAASGSYKQVFVFSNRGVHACVLRGHPGIQFVNGSGQPMATHPSYNGSYTFQEGPVKTITLRVGKSGSFDLAPPQAGAYGCSRTAAAIRVTPPHDTKHKTVQEKFAYCSGKVAVSNITSGSNGQPAPGT